jgi:hypothetical protein
MNNLAGNVVIENCSDNGVPISGEIRLGPGESLSAMFSGWKSFTIQPGHYMYWSYSGNCSARLFQPGGGVGETYSLNSGNHYFISFYYPDRRWYMYNTR